MKAMLLAAGEGTRLRPLTETVPKPMVPVAGRPLLAWTLHWLAGQGVTEVAINLFHRPQSIPGTFGAEYAGLRLHYFYEDTLRGTAGGTKAALSVLAGGPFFVVYGDNLIHADLRRLWEFHHRHGGDGTLALFSHPNPSSAGIVGLDSAGRITRFVEKPAPQDVFSDQANAGVYVLSQSVLDAIPNTGAPDFGRDIFPALLQAGAALYGTPLGGYLQDTGTPDGYRQANWDALAGLAGAAFPNPQLFVGAGAEIAPDALLNGSNVIGAGVSVGAEASLTDCILWDGASVGAGAKLTKGIVGRGARVDAGAHPPEGLILGENARYDC